MTSKVTFIPNGLLSSVRTRKIAINGKLLMLISTHSTGQVSGSYILKVLLVRFWLFLSPDFCRNLIEVKVMHKISMPQERHVCLKSLSQNNYGPQKNIYYSGLIASGMQITDSADSALLFCLHWRHLSRQQACGMCAYRPGLAHCWEP
jgi:hypothetical protein